MKQPVNVINSDPDYMMGWKSGQPVLVPKIGDGEIATFATNPLTGAVTGLVGPGGVDTLSVMGVDRWANKGGGTVMVDWASASIGTPTAGWRGP